MRSLHVGDKNSVRRHTTEQCYKLCCSSRSFSLSRQPRRGAFQGFNEGLQQECSSHRKERWHHSGGHQDDAHQPHLPGKRNTIKWFDFNMTGNPQLMVGAVVLKISVLQNEKEEALTTSVWIELVVKHHRTLFFLRCILTEQILCQTQSISACSNGVTTGSGGTSRPGPLSTGTSPNL